MNTGIGSPRGDGLHGSVWIEGCNGFFQNGLHALTPSLGLTLPTTKKRSLVLQADRNSLKNWTFSLRRGI
jgi:hypothetical protein